MIRISFRDDDLFSLPKASLSTHEVIQGSAGEAVKLKTAGGGQ